MKTRFTMVENMLREANSRRRWLCLCRQVAFLGSICCLLAILFAAAVRHGWISDRGIATGVVVLSGIAASTAFLVLLVTNFATRADRGRLASALERVDRRFLDRLNTLLFLETRPEDRNAHGFALRIAQQTRKTFARKPPQSPFSGARPLAFFCAFLVLFAGTLAIYHFYPPWQIFAVAAKAAPTAKPETARALELTPPATNNLEENKDWGEVRITEPGADLKVTRADVVPLQIEAAASTALNQVSWHSTINGLQESAHDLPPPSEPRYAVYQPSLDLNELQLSDWDVMTYYAKATTEDDKSFASQIYFLEVQPFHEDLANLPGGGAAGKAYRCLSELTALIHQQQQVIRQTHRHIQNPPVPQNLEVQTRNRLSEAESDLGDSVTHVYADMMAEFEHAPIDQPLGSLATAAHSLDAASDSLKQNAMVEAPRRERDALTELINARKFFQSAVSGNPGAFTDSDHEGDTKKLAIDESKKLSQIAEFRNDARAGRDFAQKTLEEQRRIEQAARSANGQTRGTNDLQNLASRERQLHKSLEDFQQQHPQLFRRSGSQFEAAGSAMSNAEQQMQNRSGNAQSAASEATKKLEEFSNALDAASAGQQLADAYRLKQMLDQQIQRLNEFAAADSNSPSDVDPGQTAREARGTVNQLKRAAEQEPTRDALGQPLRDALAGTNKVEINAKLSRLEQAQGRSEQQQRAQEASEALGKVSRAFGESQPATMQIAQRSDPLKLDQKESFNAGLSQLENLANQIGKESTPSNGSRRKQGQEALYNLQAGLPNVSGSQNNDAPGRDILLRLEELLKSDEPIDAEELRKLLAQLQRLSAEASDRLARKEDPEVTNIDPTKLPPAYRGRIQKYFEKLSEK